MRRREQAYRAHQLALAFADGDQRRTLAAALRARRGAENLEERAGVCDLGGLTRQRAQRRVLFVLLLERTVACVPGHLVGSRESEHDTPGGVAGHADAVAAGLTTGTGTVCPHRLVQIETACRSVGCGRPDHGGSRLR